MKKFIGILLIFICALLINTGSGAWGALINPTEINTTPPFDLDKFWEIHKQGCDEYSDCLVAKWDYNKNDWESPGDPGGISFTIYGSENNILDFSSNFLILAVAIKNGSTVVNLYNYFHDYGAGVYSDSFLIAPLNSSGGVGAISHLEFLYCDRQDVPVPEPATLILLGAGLIGLAGVARKRHKK